jgi:hypothetical protein
VFHGRGTVHSFTNQCAPLPFWGKAEDPDSMWNRVEGPTKIALKGVCLMLTRCFVHVSSLKTNRRSDPAKGGSNAKSAKAVPRTIVEAK